MQICIVDLNHDVYAASEAPMKIVLGTKSWISTNSILPNRYIAQHDLAALNLGHVNVVLAQFRR